MVQAKVQINAKDLDIAVQEEMKTLKKEISRLEKQVCRRDKKIRSLEYVLNSLKLEKESQSAFLELFNQVIDMAADLRSSE